MRGPILIFTAFYVAFLAVLWVPLSRWMPDAMQELTVSPALFGFTPPPKVVVVYLVGLASVWTGYLLTKPVAASVAPSPDPRGSDVPASRWWKWGLLLAAAAFGLQLYKVGTLPLFDISARWALSAKLVAVVSLSVGLAAGAVAMWGWRRRTWIVVGSTMLGLSIFGTRTLPMVLVVAVLCVTALFGQRRTVKKALWIAAGGVLVVMLTVGVISKTGIYNSGQPGYQASKGIALLQTDSIGTFANLTDLVQITDDSGETLHGRLLLDSLIKTVPGTSTEYSNFQLGQLLGGRSQLSVGGDVIDRSVSLSTTFVGPPYADSGWVGVIGFGAVVGALWSLLEEVAVRRRWFAGFFCYWVAEMFDSVYAGGYNTTVFSVTALCLVLAVFAWRLPEESPTPRARVRSRPVRRWRDSPL